MLGFDRDAVAMMAAAANGVMTTGQLTAIADKGYYKGEEIVANEEAGLSVVVPKPMTSNAAARGQFDKADFAYDGDLDVYVCSAGEKLTYRFTGQQDGKAIRSYWSGACAGSARLQIRTQCSDRPKTVLSAPKIHQGSGITMSCQNGHERQKLFRAPRSAEFPHSLRTKRPSKKSGSS